MNEQLKSFLKFLVTLLIGGFFLYFVFRGTDWNDLLTKFRNTDYRWIGIGLCISLLSHYLRAYRAIMLYEPMGYKVSVRHSFYAVIIGYMMNYIIPRAGEISRCAALVKTDSMPLNKSLGTVVTERVVDLFILIVLLVFIFLMQFDLIRNFISGHFSQATPGGTNRLPLKYIVLIVLVVICLAVYFMRKKLMRHPIFVKLVEMIHGFKEGLFSIRQVKNPVMFWILSLSIWFCYLTVMYVSLFSMEATSHLSMMNCLTVFAIGTIGVVLPAPAAGAGTFHFALMESLLLFGVPQADGIAYATIIHGVQMILVLVLGVICSLLVMLQHKKNQAVPG